MCLCLVLSVFGVGVTGVATTSVEVGPVLKSFVGVKVVATIKKATL